MMLCASTPSWQPGRLRSMLIGLFVLSGSLAAVNFSEVTSAAPPPKGGAKDTKAKADAGKDAAPKWPEPLKLTLVGKGDDAQDLAQLTEMVAIINKMTEEKWKE